MVVDEKTSTLIDSSDYISRDLSWVKFNDRVLDQASNEKRSIFERLKFLAITSSNFDEFFMIRVGSLYNYIDYQKERIDYSGLKVMPFRKLLLEKCHAFHLDQYKVYSEVMKSALEERHFQIIGFRDATTEQQQRMSEYFEETIFPMLTPMVYDNYHTFPILMNKRLVFGVVTKGKEDTEENKRLSFIQLPQNLPRFYEVETDDKVFFVPIEDIVKHKIHNLFRNVDVISMTIFRITRNGDFTLEESEDIETNFLEELKRKLKTRRTGRVVRLEAMEGADQWIVDLLKTRWELDDYNVFKTKNLLDFTGLWQIIKHHEFKALQSKPRTSVPPLSFPEKGPQDIFEILKNRDILLHHPYNNIEPMLDLLEKSAEDPNVLSIKLTIYRLAKESRVTAALLKAAESGKHVSVLFEVKARFDEENNLREAKKLQNAGCYVIYGISSFKTHTKLLLIVRKEGSNIRRYVHMSTGNYNEDTSELYTDLGLLTTREVYAQDVSEFFNVITGHSMPTLYQHLITAPEGMRQQLVEMIRQEASNSKNGLSSGIVIKINSLQDKETIDELYAASQAGVSIKLIVRGICCLKPGRKGLSEKIEVYSIVGDYLEHSRLFYFHNNGDSKVYAGSADVMVRSFDRRLESMFLITDPRLKQEAITILSFNLRDNVNTYTMNAEGGYHHKKLVSNEAMFDIHQAFFDLKAQDIQDVSLF